jgi:hypothetical protein
MTGRGKLLCCPACFTIGEAIAVGRDRIQCPSCRCELHCFSEGGKKDDQ